MNKNNRNNGFALALTVQYCKSLNWPSEHIRYPMNACPRTTYRPNHRHLQYTVN